MMRAVGTGLSHIYHVNFPLQLCTLIHLFSIFHCKCNIRYDITIHKKRNYDLVQCKRALKNVHLCLFVLCQIGCSLGALLLVMWIDTLGESDQISFISEFAKYKKSFGRLTQGQGVSIFFLLFEL